MSNAFTVLSKPCKLMFNCVFFGAFLGQKASTMEQISKEAAIRILYRDGVEQKEIARLLRISEVTVSRHVVKSDLKKKKLRHSIRKETSEENALTALEHQSTVVRRMAELAAEKMTQDMTMEELKACLIPKGEIDALQKLFTTIKGKELDWSHIVRIMREFMSYVKERDMALAQAVTDVADDYLNDKRGAMQ